MGSVSSADAGADHAARDDSGEEESARSAGDTEDSCQLQLKHSLGEDRTGPRREFLGIGTKYLAEENARLARMNEELKCELEHMRSMDVTEGREDRDAIYGESLEQRLHRLEKHLASERQEKWSAIESSERTRVELVNCEKELKASNETVERLAKELEAMKTLAAGLEKAAGSSSQREASMADFRLDLKAKREARQKALAAISQELNSLREELRVERAQRRKLQEELEFTRENCTSSSVEQLLSDNATLKNEMTILSENMDRMRDFSAENIRLKCEAQRRNEEIDSLNLSLGELKFEYYEEKRKHERAVRRLKEMEERASLDTKQDWEREKEELFEKYDKEKAEISRRTNALKEVVAITKQMLSIREVEVGELKKKLKDIEEAMKSWRVLQEDGLKAEYEKQLENIKHLRGLYEERVRLMETEREKLHETLEERAKRIKEKEEEVEKLAKEVETWRGESKAERHEKENVERELRLTIARTKDLENEISLINNTFTQMLLGPYNTGNETDLDKLTELLQENHDLITEMTTREDSSEIASVLPKLLLDLITQVDGVNDRKDDEVQESSDTVSDQSESLLEENQGAVLPILSYKDATLFKPSSAPQEPKPEEESKVAEQMNPTVQEIASNLPKVWRVLMELLSHHSAPEEPAAGDEKQCYKNVDTPNGPRTVISVSKTFIRLKDLILEKKALQKELTRLKQLNSHLEIRLDDQEKRLSQVQCELHKTWGIVGRMRAQHQQLHNNEKILRFELQEKRVMLSELKQELEYCRDKWERARQKNDESETEWKKLRREFAARKTKGTLLSNLNDSGESGFSDEQNESGEECDNFDADRSSTQSPVDSHPIHPPSDSHPLHPPSDSQILHPPSNSHPLHPPSDSQILHPPSNSHPLHSPSDHSDLAHQIIRQSEDNLRQTVQNVEQTRLEVCTEVQASTSRGGPGAREEERARAREARDLRLRRLEEQCKLLVRQVDITTHKSNYLSSRLEELHEQYGSGQGGAEGGREREGRTGGGAGSGGERECEGEGEEDEEKTCESEGTK